MSFFYSKMQLWDHWKTNLLYIVLKDNKKSDHKHKHDLYVKVLFSPLNLCAQIKHATAAIDLH